MQKMDGWMDGYDAPVAVAVDATRVEVRIFNVLVE